MLAWYASSPDLGGNPDLSANPPPASSPHFRPTMQSPGPPYQSTMGSAMNYSERPYENQIASHCQTNSYPSYQPPSPYRPHPVSPPAHAHQYGAHGGHQMHGGLYGSGHQLGPYGSSSHYASLSPPDLYGGRPPSMYSGGSRAMQQMKAAWGDNNSNSSTDLMQYSQPSPRAPMMPPPSMHSPPHGGGMGGATPGHYRQIPIVSAAAGHSPHSSWSQSQIPSPGVLHSPRTTPSPLPAHSRSPVGPPFSPPPTANSPLHPPPSMTPHPPTSHKTTPSPPSGSTTPAPPGASGRPPPMCGSPGGVQGGGPTSNSDPLQSLQKMVMLDSETVESPITRANYEMAANQAAAAAAAAAAAGGNPTAGPGRPASYFSVEQLAGGSDPGSPYPTYYNLDQNRLCTPPRTAMSTPTSSTFSSAPDSTSSNSPRSDSRTTTASADSSSHVGHVNGDVNPHVVNNPPGVPPQEGGPQQQQQQQPPQQQGPPPRRPDFESFGVADVRMTNGNHQPEPTGLRDDLGGPVSSDSENKDTQDFLQHLGGGVPPLPEPDGTMDLTRKSPKSPRGRRRVFGHDLQCDPLMDNSMDIPRKPMMMPEDRRNSTLPEFAITNGKPEPCDDVYPTDGGYTPRPPRYYSPTNRWGKMGPLEDGFMGMQQQSKPYPDECLSMPKVSKRGRKKKMYDQDGIVPEWDMYNTEIVHRPPRVSRGGTRGRRGSRRRGGINSYPANNGEVPMDMYSTDAMLGMRNHPSNGMGDMVNQTQEKDIPWASHGYHMGPPPNAMGNDYSSNKDGMSVIKPPMMDSMDNSPMSNMAQPNYPGDVSDDRGRGPLLFTVNKDGSTVKLQDSGQMSSGGHDPQPQYYDPVLGQMMPQPVKKKRGRPFGSKNKPKPPGEERQPRRRRKKEVFFGPEGPHVPHHPPAPIIKRRIINGPYVHIVGVGNKPLVVSIVNAPPKDETNSWQPYQFGVRHHQGLPPIYDTITKDRSWLCSLCCKNSHYRGLGDLFGPYYLGGDQQKQPPSNFSAPNSPAQLTMSGNEESSDPEDDLEDEVNPHHPTSCSAEVSGAKRSPGKRKSDLMEQMFRAALLRKAKQANGQKPLEEMSGHHLSGGDLSGQFPPMLDADSKEFWVHEECAAWSKTVYLFGHRLRGLEDTILQAVDKLCSRCKFPGASLSCARDNCPELYHYLCARDNWCHMDEDSYTIYCPQHKSFSSHFDDRQSIQNT